MTEGGRRAIGGMGARAGTPSFTGRLWRTLLAGSGWQNRSAGSGLPLRILDVVRPECMSMATSTRHQRLAEVLPVFLNQSARCVSAVNLSRPSHPFTSLHIPFACAADPGRQSRLTFAAAMVVRPLASSTSTSYRGKQAGLRLSLL